jgi:hypothetical protein
MNLIIGECSGNVGRLFGVTDSPTSRKTTGPL